MPDWIYLLPDDAIIALSVAAIVGATFLALLLCHRVAWFRMPAEHGDAVWEGYRVVVSLTALVLAFSLVQAQNNLRTVQTELRREASALLELDREILRLDIPVDDLHRSLVQYGQAIVSDEWPLQVQGRRSRQVDGILVDMLRMSRQVGPQDSEAPAIRGSLVRKLEQLADLREDRLTSATLRLPRAFWRATMALVLVTVLLAGATRWTKPYLMAVLLVSAALAVLIALVAIVDVPFRGESAVRPTELRRAVDAMLSKE